MSLRKKCPYSEFFCSVFSRIWTEYRPEKTSDADTFRVVYILVEGENRRFYAELFFTTEINTQYLLLVYYLLYFQEFVMCFSRILTVYTVISECASERP